jgi:hypothetical protein
VRYVLLHAPLHVLLEHSQTMQIKMKKKQPKNMNNNVDEYVDDNEKGCFDRVLDRVDLFEFRDKKIRNISDDVYMAPFSIEQKQL